MLDCKAFFECLVGIFGPDRAKRLCCFCRDSPELVMQNCLLQRVDDRISGLFLEGASRFNPLGDTVTVVELPYKHLVWCFDRYRLENLELRVDREPLQFAVDRDLKCALFFRDLERMGFFAPCKRQLYIKRKFKRIGRLCLLHLYLHTVAIMQKIDLELGVTLPENPLVKELL